MARGQCTDLFSDLWHALDEKGQAEERSPYTFAAVCLFVLIAKIRQIIYHDRLQNVLREQPRTGSITIQTQLVPSCQGQGQAQGRGVGQGQGQGLGFIPNLHCAAVGDVTEPLARLVLPSRVTHLTDSKAGLAEGYHR